MSDETQVQDTAVTEVETPAEETEPAMITVEDAVESEDQPNR